MITQFDNDTKNSVEQEAYHGTKTWDEFYKELPKMNELMEIYYRNLFNVIRKENK